MNHIRNRPFRVIALAAALLISFAVAGYAGGDQVTLVLRDSTTITAELISVRAGSLVLGLHPWVPEEQLRTHLDWIEVIPLERTTAIHLPGHRNPIIGGLWGIGAGVVIGALRGYDASTSGNFFSHNRFVNAEVGAFIGILPGFLAGAVIGTLIESDARDFDANDETQMALLAKHSRYPENEPDFLRDLDTR